MRSWLFAWMIVVAVAGSASAQATNVPAAAAVPASAALPTVAVPRQSQVTLLGAAESPWLDLAPQRAGRLAIKAEPASDHRLASALTLGGLYAGFTTWTYFAWYRKHKPLEQFRFGCFFCDGKDGNYEIWNERGWFASHRYAGGADKLGHAWATMGLTRAGVEMLSQWGGFDRTASIWVSGALAELLFFGVEIKDGFYYEFSFGDLTFNTLGVAFGMALSHWPRLDDLLDFRVQYWPGDDYRARFAEGTTGINIAEDYSGQTYLLALHLGGLAPLRDSRWGRWSRYVDVVAGFGARGYKPEPPAGTEPNERQEMFLGLSLNAQGIFDDLLGRRAPTARKITHGLFEVMNLPFTSLPALEHSQRPSSPAQNGGA